MKFFPKTSQETLIHQTIKSLYLTGWTMQGAIDRLREESRIDPSTHGFDHKELDAFIERSTINNMNLSK